jgi:electron transfer flavoprotein alpha subunit
MLGGPGRAAGGLREGGVRVWRRPLLCDARPGAGKGYRNEPYTKGLTDLVNAHQPEIMLLGASTMGRDLAGSVATTLGTGLTADCTELNIDGRALAATGRPSAARCCAPS